MTHIDEIPGATSAVSADPASSAFDGGPIVTAAAVLAWREQVGRRSIPSVPARAILVLDPSALHLLRRRRWLRERPGPAGRFWAGRASGEADPTGVLAVTGAGGPVIAVAIEELVALGAREVLSIGLGGGLGEGVSSGDVVVVDEALPRDGVSAAYGATDRPLPADPRLRAEIVISLARSGLAAVRGRAWTTDAVYRETSSRVAEATDAGAVVVEMEAAAILAVSRALGARAAAVVVIGDRIVDGRWLPPDDLARCRRAEAGVIDALLDR